MDDRDAAVRQEILERVRHKHQRPGWLVQNVSAKLGVSGDVVQRILQQLISEGLVKNVLINDIEMVSAERK